MRKARIAVITSGELPVPSVKGGAVEKLVTTFSKMNDKYHDFDLDIYSIWNDDLTPQSGITKFFYYNSSFYNAFKKIDARIRNRLPINPYLSFVRTNLSKRNYDYVIIENRYSFVEAISESTDAKIYLHMHNSHLLPVSDEKRRAIAACDGILLVSEYLKTEAAEAYPEFQSKMMVWYNGVNVEKFSKKYSSERVCELRRSLNIDTGTFVVTFVGRIVQEKGVLELIRAFKLAMESIPQIKLMVIGTSWYADKIKSSYFERVKSEAKPVENNIVFTGFIDNDMLPLYLHASNVLVYPSMWNEPFGLTIVEGLSTGKPTVSFANGAIPELYKDCGNQAGNLLIRLTDKQKAATALANTLIKLHGEYRQYDGINQINSMMNHFSERAYYERAIQLFKDSK